MRKMCIRDRLEKLFGTRIMFFLDNGWFRTLVILSDVWKGMGYNMVIFLAAIMGCLLYTSRLSTFNRTAIIALSAFDRREFLSARKVR